MIFFDINLISWRLYETHLEYLIITISIINFTVYIIAPYFYFYMESIRNTEEESKDLSTTESGKLIH